MSVDQPSGKLRSWPVYVLTLASCAIFLGLALMTFQINTDDATPARPDSGPRASRLLSSWQAIVRPVAPVGRAVVNAAAVPSASTAPVILSRVPDDGKTGADLPEDLAEDLATVDVDEWASSVRWSPDRSGTFRTVCVRLCDGAFFPISFATTRDRFKIDAARCKSECGSPVRLFVGPPDGDADDLADVKGNGYAQLSTAFKFRTVYDASCTCKAHPWEAAERARHQGLAEAAKTAALKPVGQETRAASQAAIMTPQLADRTEISALHPQQSLRTIAPTEPARLVAARPESVAVTGSVAAAITVVEVNDRRLTGSRPVGRGVAKKAAKVPSTASVSVIVNPFQVVIGPPPKVAKAKLRAVDTSMQRPFKPKEYWRLSYWDVSN